MTKIVKGELVNILIISSNLFFIETFIDRIEMLNLPSVCGVIGGSMLIHWILFVNIL